MDADQIRQVRRQLQTGGWRRLEARLRRLGRQVRPLEQTALEQHLQHLLYIEGLSGGLRVEPTRQQGPGLLLLEQAPQPPHHGGFTERRQHEGGDLMPAPQVTQQLVRLNRAPLPAGAQCQHDQQRQPLLLEPPQQVADQLSGAGVGPVDA